MKDVDKIFTFLCDVTRNNTREWFTEHRAEYDEARAVFEDMVQQTINRIATFDGSVTHLQVKDCTYRFHRDTRFSEDKAPYKRHFGAYINARGKKSFHSGYYLHIQPGECLLAGGSWCLPSPMLRAIRNTIVDEIDQFRAIVERPEFKAYFPVIGEERVQTAPKGFARDYPYLDYIRPKDFSVACRVSDDFFRSKGWLDEVDRVFQLMKPFNDFVNEVIDDFD